jgi:hypothetical protein
MKTVAYPKNLIPHELSLALFLLVYFELDELPLLLILGALHCPIEFFGPTTVINLVSSNCTDQIEGKSNNFAPQRSFL